MGVPKPLDVIGNPSLTRSVGVKGIHTVDADELL
jgi:hypothetical protein